MRNKSVIPLLVGMAALLSYLATLAPSLTWAHWGADGGDFSAAAVAGRMPHPPGFPLYLTFARVFVLLPARDPAWRLNLLSALMAAGTVTLTALTLQRRENSAWIVLSASLTLAFAPLFWSQALITEVYTMAAFWAALGFWVINGEVRVASGEWRVVSGEWRSASGEWRVANCELRSASWRWGLAGIVCGLGMAVHPTLLFLLPLWLAYLLRYSTLWKACLPPISHLPSPVSRLLSSVSRLPSPVYRLPSTVYLIGVTIGLLPYALLPLLGRWPQPWGDARTFAGWWAMVTAQLYRGYAFGLPLVEWPARLAAWAALLARQFTPAGGALVLLGGWWGWRERRAETLGLAAAGGLLSLFAIGYAAPDSLVYLLPLLPLAVPLLAAGLRELVDRGAPAWAALLLPLVLLAWNWQAVDLRRDDEAVLWYNRVLTATPADAVVLTTQGDAYTFALWYAQEAVGLRPDVLVIDRNLWWQESYRQYLFAQTGRAVAAPEDYAVGRPLCRIVEEGVACP